MKYIITLFIIVIAVCPTLGQDQDEQDVNLNQISSFGYGDYAQSNAGNGVFIAQAGAQNLVDIKQYRGNSGGNTAISVQGGVRQSAKLVQDGHNNRALFGQGLYNNQIDVAQYGGNISSEVIQVGFGNKVEQQLGSDNASYTVIQFGNNWGVIDRGFSSNSPGYTIKQAGLVGTTITIQQY